MKYKHYFLAIFLILAIIATSCEDNPAKHDDHDHHFEAIGLYIINSGDTTASYVDGKVTDGISVKVGELSPLFSVKFIEEDGDVGIPESSEHSFAWEVANSDIAEVHTHGDEKENFKFHIKGKQIGSTGIKILINHNDHKDFESKLIPITVTE